MRNAMIENPVCPYCGHIHKGPLFFDNKKIKCSNCGKIYEYDFYIFYSSWKEGEK